MAIQDQFPKLYKILSRKVGEEKATEILTLYLKELDL